MYRLKDNEAHESSCKDGQHFTHVGAQKELDGLSDVVIDAASFFNCVYYGSKVIICQYHVSYVLCNISTGDSHAYADISGFDGGSVVNSVSCHGGDEACLLPSVYDPGLVFRLNTCIH